MLRWLFSFPAARCSSVKLTIFRNNFHILDTMRLRIIRPITPQGGAGKWRGTNQIQLSHRACIPIRENISFLGGEIFDIQIWDPWIKAIVCTTIVNKNFSHIDGVSGFSDWERAVRLINYMRGTFIENKLKIVTTTVAEIRETEKLIFL